MKIEIHATKTTFRSLLVLFLIVFSFQQIGFGQWQKSFAPPFGNVEINKIYHTSKGVGICISSCGFYMKSDTEAVWRYNNSIDYIGANIFATKGDSLFISYYDEIKLLVLSKPDSLIPFHSFYLGSCLAMSSTDTCLYTGSEFGFSKYSFINNKKTSHYDGLPSEKKTTPAGGEYYLRTITAIDKDENYIFCGTTKGVYKNTKSLGTWVAKNNGLPLEEVLMLKVFNDTLLAVIGKNIYISYNQGDNWKSVLSTKYEITNILKVKNIIYVSTIGNGVLSSDDGGANWNNFNIGSENNIVNSLSYSDSFLYIGTHQNGLITINNTGISKTITEINCNVFKGLIKAGKYLIPYDGSKVYRLDSNSQLLDISPKLPNKGIIQVVSNDTILYVLLNHRNTENTNDSNYIGYSLDFGKTWSNLNSYNFYSRSDQNIYSSKDKFFIISTYYSSFTNDFGNKWEELSKGPNEFRSHRKLLYYKDKIFGITTNSSFVEYTSNGWQRLYYGLPKVGSVSNYAFNDQELFIKIGSDLFVSLDTGKTWYPANNGLPNGAFISSFAYHKNHTFLATNYGVFLSSNFGADWQEMNQGFSHNNIQSIVLLNDTLYAKSSDKYVYKRALNEIHLSVNESITHKGIKLYPNPANERITVELIDDKNISTPSIKLFDIMGKEVTQFTTLNQTDTKRYQLDIQLLSSGSYIVNYQTKEKVCQERFIKY